MAENRDQVIFESVAKSYPIDAHVECRYTMRPTHQSTTYDWIGLFKVGWANHKEFVFYHWVPYPKDRIANEEYRHSILFQSVHLPKEDGEYYQFVYFNDKGKMCGASSPFYFCVPRNEDIIEEVMLEDEDMLYITTKRGQLQEKRNECEKLAKTCEAMDEEIRNLSEQLKAVDDSKCKLEQENAELVEKLELTESRDEQLQAAEQKLLEREKLVEELKAEVVQLQMSIETLKMEQTLLLEQLKVAEDSKTEEVDELKKKMEETLMDKEAFETLQAQLSSSQETIESLKQKKRQQKAIINDQHDKLQATEARHSVDLLEIATLNETLSNLSLKVEEVNYTNEELKSGLSKVTAEYEIEKNDWVATLETMEKEKNRLLSTIGELNHKLEQLLETSARDEPCDVNEDRYIALQNAYKDLRAQLAEQRKELETLQRREQKHKVVSAAQIDELKGKLAESQEEYVKLGAQKIKLERRLQKSNKAGGALDTSPLKRSLSSVSRDDLTKEELQKMVEQLSAELEARTQKKDRYKEKYLDEKQRAATMRDYYKGETDKLKGELAVARAQLDSQKSRLAAAAGPIVYPEVPSQRADEHGALARKSSGHSKRQRAHDGSGDKGSKASGDKSSKGALEQSIVEDKRDQLPAPLEPIKTREEPKLDNLAPQATSRPDHSSEPYPSTIMYPVQKNIVEEVVLPPHHSDSEDDNENGDRFHDASDVPTGIIKCFLCDKVFGIDDTTEMRNAHACEHFDMSLTIVPESSVEHYHCPICTRDFFKNQLSLDDMQAHVNAHFTQPQ